MTAPRSRFAHGWVNDHQRDSLARLIDRPPPSTMADVLSLTLTPTARFIARHAAASARAIWAALRAGFTTYRESINVHP